MERDGQFGPGRLVRELSTEYQDIMPNVRVRDDGLLEIVFSSELAEQRSTVSNDGRRLYFGRDNDIYMSPRRGNH